MSGWVCQHPNCAASDAQLAELRARRPEGFAHDEDPSLRVCTVCRRLPLPRNGRKRVEEPSLDASFLDGIKEELASIEENEQNIQSLSQVFRFYAGNAKQLVGLLTDFITKQCFPWEIIHALHLLDDILLMDNTSSYKIELKDRIQGLTVQAFRKVQSDLERREVARMIHAWRELKIFDIEVLNAISKTLRSNEAHGRILDEEEDDDDAVAPPAAAPIPVPQGVPPVTAPYPGMSATGARMTTGEAKSKKAKVATSISKAATAPVPKALSEKVLNTINRILSVPVEQPFELLALKSDCKASEIRTAYRKIALLIHPDKNPGSEAKCKEALIKLQQGREQAESDLQMRASGGTKKNNTFVDMADLGEAKPANKCQYPGCDLPPCKQCPNRCCTRNITHCHMLARSKGGLHCFFHPPPRSWARNAEA